jgi:hypothetical protein
VSAEALWEGRLKPKLPCCLCLASRCPRGTQSARMNEEDTKPGLIMARCRVQKRRRTRAERGTAANKGFKGPCENRTTPLLAPTSSATLGRSVVDGPSKPAHPPCLSHQTAPWGFWRALVIPVITHLSRLQRKPHRHPRPMRTLEYI